MSSSTIPQLGLKPTIRPAMAFLLAMILVYSLFQGCGSRSSAEMSAPEAKRSLRLQVTQPPPGGAGTTSTISTSAAWASTRADARKMVYTQHMDLLVENLDDAFTRIAGLTRKSGGYLASSSMDLASRDNRSASVTIKVPQREFDAMVQAIGKLGTLRSSSCEAQDVTREYADLEARLRNAQAEERRLLAFIDRANTIKELLAVDEQLSKVREKVETLTGELNVLINQVAFSTIEIQIHERGGISSATWWNLRQTVRSALRALVWILSALIRLAIYLVILGIPLLLIIYLILLLRKWLIQLRRRP